MGDYQGRTEEERRWIAMMREDGARIALPQNPTDQEIQAFLADLPERRREAGYIPFYNEHRLYFNCYAYASGSLGSPYYDRQGTNERSMAIPGALSGAPMEIATAAELDRAVIADGYERAGLQSIDANPGLVRPGYTLVAAFIDDESDQLSTSFHFAVRSNSGQWSHKNGGSEIYTDIGHPPRPLRPPHEHADDYLGDRYRFAGYYWRRDSGINVIGAEPLVTAFGRDGNIITGGLYSPERVRDDIWVGTRGDYIATNFEIAGWSLVPNEDGSARLGLRKADGTDVFVNIPPSLIFPEYTWNGGVEGVRIMEIDDPSGPDLRLRIMPDGRVRDVAQEGMPGRQERDPFAR